MNQIYREHHIKLISSLSGETGNSEGKVSQSDMFLVEPNKLDIKKNIYIAFCLSCIKECRTNGKQLQFYLNSYITNALYITGFPLYFEIGGTFGLISYSLFLYP